MLALDGVATAAAVLGLLQPELVLRPFWVWAMVIVAARLAVLQDWLDWWPVKTDQPGCRCWACQVQAEEER